jgi:hypothetical protein
MDTVMDTDITRTNRHGLGDMDSDIDPDKDMDKDTDMTTDMVTDKDTDMDIGVPDPGKGVCADPVNGGAILGKGGPDPQGGNRERQLSLGKGREKT